MGALLPPAPSASVAVVLSSPRKSDIAANLVIPQVAWFPGAAFCPATFRSVTEVLQPHLVLERRNISMAVLELTEQDEGLVLGELTAVLHRHGGDVLKGNSKGRGDQSANSKRNKEFHVNLVTSPC